MNVLSFALVSKAESLISAWQTLACDRAAVGVTLFPQQTQELIEKA